MMAGAAEFVDRAEVGKARAFNVSCSGSSKKGSTGGGTARLVFGSSGHVPSRTHAVISLMTEYWV